jgi:translation initiation factor 5A
MGKKVESQSSGSDSESDYEQEFDQSTSGASDATPKPANTLKKGQYIVVDNKPCKVIDVTFSKNGKHGHSKANYIATDIFTGKRYEEVCPSSRILFSPVVETATYTLVDISEDGYMQLLDENNLVKEDLKLPEGEDGKKIEMLFSSSEESVLIGTISAMGMEGVTSIKVQ